MSDIDYKTILAEYGFKDPLGHSIEKVIPYQNLLTELTAFRARDASNDLRSAYMHVWLLIDSRHPKVGEDVLLWHPALGPIRATRVSEGFVELGKPESDPIDGPIDWWCELPGRPPGVAEPSAEAWDRAKKLASEPRSIGSVGFAPPADADGSD